jgi:hypothetical protein
MFELVVNRDLIQRRSRNQFDGAPRRAGTLENRGEPTAPVRERGRLGVARLVLRKPGFRGSLRRA